MADFQVQERWFQLDASQFARRASAAPLPTAELRGHPIVFQALLGATSAKRRSGLSITTSRHLRSAALARKVPATLRLRALTVVQVFQQCSAANFTTDLDMDDTMEVELSRGLK